MSERISKAEKIQRAIFNFLFPAFDALSGWLTGLRNLGTANFWDFKSHTANQEENTDQFGKLLPTTAKLTRLLTVAAATLCVLGFIGTLFIPIPGVSPLYAVTAVGICKATGITMGWSAVARFMGAVFGAICDFFKLRSIIKGKTTVSKEATNNKTPHGSTSLILGHMAKDYAKIALHVGLFGEIGPHLVTVSKRKNAIVAPATPETPAPLKVAEHRISLPATTETLLPPSPIAGNRSLPHVSSDCQEKQGEGEGEGEGAVRKLNFAH